MAALARLVAEDVVTHAVIVGQVAEAPMIGCDATSLKLAQLQAATPPA